jgi:glycosyltransferase involved in cell wall biosynthesis
VSPGGEAPLNVRMQHTLYPHWGGRSGYVRLAGALDPGRVHAGLQGASDSDADLPAWLAPAKPVLALAVRGRAMPWYKMSDLVAEWRIAGECRKGLWDLVHCLDGEHGVRFLPQMLSAIRRRVPVVASFHQPPDIADRLVSPAVLRRLDAVILMAPSQRGWAERHVAPERVHVILHGVDVDFFRPAPAPAERARLRCITVGNWLRDWPVFAAVAGALPDVDFLAVTGARAVPALPNVSVRTGLSDEALATLYREADIAFLPLTGSTANNAILEGMASGLPLVVSDLAAVRAYVPGDAGLLVEGSADRHVAAIRRLAADPSLRLTMGRAARRRAESLSWPKVAGQHEDIYREVLRAAAGKR